jgi:PAT family beta-lactamase induction signal transducer AmpG
MRSRINKKLTAFKKSSHRYFLHMMSFGVSSGIASFFLFATVSVWLADSGVPATQRGILLWMSLPYPLKLFLSPLIEIVTFGALTRRVGPKKTWVLLSQSGIVLSLIALSFVNLNTQLWMIAPLCFFLALCGTLQDSTLEGYRIQITPADQQRVGAQANSSGFRVGMWIASSVPLLLAYYVSWRVAFWGVAAFVFMGMCVVSAMKEPPSAPPLFSKKEYYTRYILLLKESLLFFKRTYFFGSVLLLIAIYKLADIFIRALSSPFFLDQGYTTADIANIDKSLGIISMLLGVYVGSRLIGKKGMSWSMRFWAGTQAMCTLLFLTHALVGKNYALLVASLSINNLICGIGATVWMTYLSDLCKPNKQIVIVDYAFLTSVGSFARLVTHSSAEFTIAWLSWPACFVLSFLVCLPIFFMTWSQKPFMQRGELFKE